MAVAENLLSVEMFFAKQKPLLTPRFFYFKQHFPTSEEFCNEHDNACFIS